MYILPINANKCVLNYYEFFRRFVISPTPTRGYFLGTTINYSHSGHTPVILCIVYSILIRWGYRNDNNITNKCAINNVGRHSFVLIDLY